MSRPMIVIHMQGQGTKTDHLEVTSTQEFGMAY